MSAVVVADASPPPHADPGVGSDPGIAQRPADRARRTRAAAFLRPGSSGFGQVRDDERSRGSGCRGCRGCRGRARAPSAGARRRRRAPLRAAARPRRGRSPRRAERARAPRSPSAIAQCRVGPAAGEPSSRGQCPRGGLARASSKMPRVRSRASSAIGPPIICSRNAAAPPGLRRSRSRAWAFRPSSFPRSRVRRTKSDRPGAGAGATKTARSTNPTGLSPSRTTASE